MQMPRRVMLAIRTGVGGAGVRWQRGQRYDERFMKGSRRIGVPQRGQGSPSWP